MKTINRIDVVVRLVCLALSLFFAGTAQAQTHVINFDDRSDGTIIAGQYPLVTFLNSPMVVSVTNRWLGLTTFSSPMALYKGSAGPIRIQFARPQGRVRVYVGSLTLLGGPCTAVLRAYAPYPNDRHPMATDSIVMATPNGITNALEVVRPLDGDISAVEVEFPGIGFTLLDHLEYEIITPAYHGVVDFDDVTSGTPICRNYPGVTFPAWPVTVLMGDAVNTYSPPNALRNPIRHEVMDPDPMVIWFDPPQGIVRLQVGNPYETSQHITLRAYHTNAPPSASLDLLAWTSMTLPPGTDIGYPLEIIRWYDQDINYVEVEYSGTEWEYIDHLEFGPNMPSGVIDTNPPQVYFDSPTNGTVAVQSGPTPPAYQSILLQGHIIDGRGLAQVTLYHSCNGVGVSTNSILGEVVSPPPPGTTYTFQHVVPTLLTGTNRFRITAVDLTGLVSTNAEREIVVYSSIPEPMTVSHVSPTNGSVTVVREADGSGHPRLQIPPTGLSVTFTGANLHTNMYLYMMPEEHGSGESSFYPGSYVTNYLITRSPDISSMTAPIPDYVFDGYPYNYYRWWIWDIWPGYMTNIMAGTFTNTHALPPYPAIWGFGFHNEEEVGGYYDFQGVYGDNCFCDPFNCIIDPFYLIWLPIYCGIMDEMTGECTGFSSESLLMYNGYDTPANYDGNVIYPSGFQTTGKPDTYTHPLCGHDSPINLWAHIVVNQGVMLSRDFFLNAVMQMHGDDHGVRGNPVARLNDLRPYIAANSLVNTISLMPGFGDGHTLVPYAIEDQPDGRHTHIKVYDCNRPFHAEQDPSSSTNQNSTGIYVDVDRIANTYSMDMGSLGTWTGTGMYLIPLNMWLNERHAPGLEMLGEGTALLLMIICGSSDAQYTTPDGGQFGWNAGGSLTDTISNSVPFNVFGSGGYTNRNVFLVLESNTYSSFNIQANVRKDGRYLFHSAQAGRVLQLEVLNAHGGDTEALSVGCADQIANSFEYTPTRDGTVFWPKLGLALGEKDHAFFQWYGLNPGAGGKLEFRNLPDQKSVELFNHSANPLNPLLVVHWANGTNSLAGTNAFTPPTIPPGGLQHLKVFQWPPVDGKLYCQMDTNGDGTFDYSLTITGTNFFNQPPVPGTNAIVVVKNSTTNLTASTLLASASDPEGDPLSIPSVTSPTLNGGTVTLAGGVITYVPSVDYIGPDTIIYTLADSFHTVRGMVSVTVNEKTAPTMPCETNGIKYIQMPDLQNGMDVLSGYDWSKLKVVLADDFVCTNTGPVSDIHIWCSWLNDVVDSNTRIWLGIYDDVPATNNQPSHPGNLKWSQWFEPGNYSPNLYTTGFELFYDPTSQTCLGSDNKMYYYCFTLPSTNGFTQNGTEKSSEINWLAVYAEPQSVSGSQFGWKTCASQQNDAAVRASWNGAPPSSGWQTIMDTNYQNLDLSFVINTSTNCAASLICFTNIVQCGSSWTLDPPQVDDPCCQKGGTPVLVAVTNYGSCPWIVQAIWNYTNCLGNTAVGTNTIIVQDTNPPVLIVPPGGDLGLNPTVPDDAAMLGQVAVSDDCGILLTNVSHVDGSNGSTFSRAFTIYAEDLCYNMTTTNVAYTWTVDNKVPVTITAQPQSQTVPAGSDVTLTVAASGAPTLAYQWYFNSNILSGAVGATLTLASFQATNQGSYYVVITNPVNAVVSDTAKLYLEAPLRFVNPVTTSNGWFQSRLLGPADGSFVIQWSTNLKDWHPLTTNDLPVGILDFTDTNQFRSRPRQFYRAWQAQ